MTETKSSNQENVVQCPVSGCSHEGLSRGMHLHVRQSSGNGHGPHGDIPDSLDMGNLEVVGQREVQMEYPEDREVDNTARACPFCGNAFQGYRGLKIHLGQKQGQGVHPKNAAEKIQKEDAPIVEVDDDMNVKDIIDAREMMPSMRDRLLGQESKDTIPVSKVEQFIEKLEAEDRADVANQAREFLLL